MNKMFNTHNMNEVFVYCTEDIYLMHGYYHENVLIYMWQSLIHLSVQFFELDRILLSINLPEAYTRVHLTK